VTTPTNYREYVEQVRAASDLVALVAERFTLTANMIVCPFHPDTRPSLHVDPGKQFFFCFGCKASGDVFAWLERLDGVGFRAAVESLAKRAGLPSFSPMGPDATTLLSERQMHDAVDWFASYYEQRLTPEAREYLTDARHLPKAFIEQFRLGWSDGSAAAAFLTAAGPTWAPILQAAGIAVERQGRMRDHLWERVIFPGLLRQRATFLTGRTLKADVEPKYLNQRGMDALLYNEEDVNPDVVIAVEGQIDALSVRADGLATVGCLGGVKTKHLQKLRRVRRVYACFDPDRAGVESTLKLCEALGNAVRVITLPDGRDPNALWAATGPGTFPPLVEQAADPVAWALTLFPPKSDPVEESAQLDPLFRILARRTVREQELYWERAVVPRLHLSPAGARRVRETLVEYATAQRQRCAQCGAEYVGGKV
jgi:DNA primase